MAGKRDNFEDQQSNESNQAPQSPQQGDEKVGGDREAAEKFGGKMDFGIPVGQAVPHDFRPHNPEHPSVEDQEDDHRGIGPKGTGQRTRGVGTEDRGKPGHGSGGDVDTDVIGVGTGGTSVTASGDIHDPPGPDDVEQGGSAPMASGPPAEGNNQAKPGKVGGNKRVKGGTVHDRRPDTAGDQGT